jgi:hypothetical protein
MKPTKIIIHCSDSEFASIMDIDSWHRERGFDMVGYHFVITNSKPDKGSFMPCLDGQINTGRALDQDGAHAKGFNDEAFGICMVGKLYFSQRQLLGCKAVVDELMAKYDISIENVFMHNEIDKNKTCPNLAGNQFRDFILGRIGSEDITQGGLGL